MTIQQKVVRMSERMNQLRAECRPGESTKQHFYSLLYDAVRFTGARIVELSEDSLVEYIELAAVVAGRCDIPFMTLRTRLVQMGFNTSPVN